MSRQLLNLPINIPWKQIAVSPDMMDMEFCNKLFPFAWRSSMAISAYEPDPADLPEELCGDRITYLKITTTITGYQPTQEETRLLDNLEEGLRISFPDFPIEDLKNAIDRITDDYFACYGVLLNVAVFPYPKTKRDLVERVRVDFSQLRQPNSTDFFKPGATLNNPYEHPSGVTFKASDQPQNQLVNIIPQSGGTDAELDLHTKMVISIPATAGLAAIEAKVTYANAAGVKMEAFRTGESVGAALTEAEPGQAHTLVIEADDIDMVVLTAPENEASLLEFAYFVAKEVALTLEDYPHIIDFEPKRRDLYQAATESGEVLSGSKSVLSTNKALIHTESTENSVTFEGKAKASGGFGPIEIGYEAAASTKQTNTESDQDQWSVQTDASRERRETQGTTTQLSQMYNLLTGYHAGTNRAVFLMLARPHVLQPTDFRTFVQGLRAIEGQQDYFLIVARPESIEGLCIEAVLETGNYPEDTVIEEPPEEFDETFLDFTVPPVTAKGGKAEVGLGLFSVGGTKAQCKDIDKIFELPLDSIVVDQRPQRMRPDGQPPESGWDPGHPGVAFLDRNDQQAIPNLNYGVTGGALVVSGKLCGTNANNVSVGSGLDGISTTFGGTFRVFFRSEQPKTSYQEPHADLGRLLITNRGLCACFKSGECLEIVSPPISPEKPPRQIESIVDEPVLKMNKALLTRDASSHTRLPAQKEFLQKIQTALTTSFRSPKRHAFGEVGFLESDYFKDQIKHLLPERHLKSPIGQVKGLPDEVVKALGDDLTIEKALSIDLARFARRTGLSIKDASNARQLLLGISLLKEKVTDNAESKNNYQD